MYFASLPVRKLVFLFDTQGFISKVFVDLEMGSWCSSLDIYTVETGKCPYQSCLSLSLAHERNEKTCALFTYGMMAMD